MKKLILILALALICCSCQTSQFFTVRTSLLDFRPYTEKGFIMSTTTIGIKYETIGEIYIECTGGYDSSKLKIKETPEGNEYANIGMKTPIKVCNVDGVLFELYNEAVKTGANGIINLKIDFPVTVKGSKFKKIMISGLAIKTR